MDSTRQTAAKGLFLIFWGTLIYAFGGIIPLAGRFIAALGGLLCLYGIFFASKAHKNYKSALYATILYILSSLLAALISFPLLNHILNMFISIFNLSIVYFVCMATAELLGSRSPSLVIWANRVWMTALFCTIISLAGIVFAIFSPLISGIISFAASVISLITAIAYLVLLYVAQDKLKKA